LAVDARIRAALADAGWPPCLTAIDTGNVNVQTNSYPLDSGLLEVLQYAADAELPRARAALRRRRRPRHLPRRRHRFDAAVKGHLGDSAWLAALWVPIIPLGMVGRRRTGEPVSSE
jgi:hypothetical protein